MRKNYLAISILFLFSGFQSVSAQDTLFYTNFNSNPTGFTLNTIDVNSTASGSNSWVENNSYAGGNGTLVCLGFPFTFTVPPTPSQPLAVTGSPNSTYLHILSSAAQSSGVNNCCFLAADGICTFTENNFSRMSADISTTGFDTVTISFWWLCSGGNESYGELYYSSDGGVSWILNTSQLKYNNSGNWTLKTITDPAWANLSSLRFGFRFVNEVTTAATDPAFGIDEILITGEQAITLPVAALSVNDSAFCQETCLSFTDLSLNSPITWQWYFEGAAPDTSSMQHPQQICYDDSGTFDVTLIVTNASGTDTIVYTNFITVYANPPIPAVSVNGDTLCTVTNMAAYQWYFNGPTAIPGAVNNCYSTIFPGSYTVQITDSNGCVTISDPVIISSIADPSGSQFGFYPNPANDQVTVISITGVPFERIQIHDMSGRVVLQQESFYDFRSVELDIEQLPAGLYMLYVFQNGSLSPVKLIVSD